MDLVLLERLFLVLFESFCCQGPFSIGEGYYLQLLELSKGCSRPLNRGENYINQRYKNFGSLTEGDRLIKYHLLARLSLHK